MPTHTPAIVSRQQAFEALPDSAVEQRQQAFGELLRERGDHVRSLIEPNPESAEELAVETLRLLDEHDEIASPDITFEATRLLLALCQLVRERDDIPNLASYAERAHHYAEELRADGDEERGALQLSKTIFFSGDASYQSKDYEAADRLLAESIALCREINNPKTLGAALAKMVELQYRNSNFERTIRLGEEALAIFEELNDKRGKATVLVQLGGICKHTADFQQGIEYLSSAVKLLLEIGNVKKAGNAKTTIGVIYTSLGQFEKALANLREGLALAESIDAVYEVMYSLNGLGIVYEQTGKYAFALDCYERALSMTEDSINPRLVAAIYLNLGNVYAEHDESEKALHCYSESEKICADEDDLYHEMLAAASIGIIHAEQERYDEARPLLSKAAEVFKSVGDTHTYAIATLELGLLNDQIEEFDEATRWHAESAKIFAEAPDKHRGGCLALCHGIRHANEKFDGYNLEIAEAKTREAERVFAELGAKKERERALRTLADILEQSGDIAGAFAVYRDAVELDRELRLEKTRKKAAIFDATRKLEVIKKEQEVVASKNAELEALAERLQQLNDEKNELLGIAAHDLKNPLASITLQLGMLEKNRSSPSEVTAALTPIRKRAQGMIDLISRILDVHSIDEEADGLECYPFDFAEAVRRVVESFEAQADHKGITLDAEIDRVTVHADRPSVMQIVENLISNGLKYTPQGGRVTVRVSGEDDQAVLSVTDTGPGISAEDHGRLFERFSRLSATPTGGEMQSGLGLWIVRRLCEAMGGSVCCDSVLGEGARFEVRLPFESLA